MQIEERHWVPKDSEHLESSDAEVEEARAMGAYYAMRVHENQWLYYNYIFTYN